MASLKQLAKKMNLSTGLGGVGGLLVDGAVGFGASFAIGQVYHRKGDTWYGRNVARLAAAVGKGGAVLLSMASGGRAGLAVGLANSIGQAGLNAWGLDLGLRHARAASGKKAVLLPASADLSKITGASDVTSMGALGRAAPGRGMSWSQIEELASGR